ncbi:MAG: helix-turn-helix transcriptional regulator, partial [Planctomycetaceae bacterium]|nr:helix-turn-helix transcriptional regulator [Planctomycetaceae bacterium]
MSDSLSQTFAALADPTRRAMLARLAKDGEITVSELAEPFLDQMSLPAVTKHVKVLERAGLVTKKRKAQQRPCELNSEGLKDAVEWM